MKTYSVYTLEIANKFEKEDIYKILLNLYRLFKRVIEKDRKYYSICFVMGISNTDSKTAKITFLHNNKKGRPKKVITGCKTNWHLHIYIFNDGSGTSSFCNHIKDVLNTKKGYNIILRKHNSAYNALEYTAKQCNSVWAYGDFYFKNLVKEIVKATYKKGDL